MPETAGSASLLHGLADAKLAAALRAMHAAPGRAWRVEDLAREAALSRSTFFAHFHAVVGLSPMEYLKNWRMALAKKQLRSGHATMAEIAAQVGYGSSSAFSTAFTREVGCPPAKFAQQGDL
ncbi:helix-turn-helix transcriptional regulator [Limimaricola soesokkakensis]|uniref:helix-turn-helix transcriptional regulator n=1 Tax=Limimaricola soesokkakensis TaxID=1343159 RepID=UPI0035120FD7